jgi:hypothetical protein
LRTFDVVLVAADSPATPFGATDATHVRSFVSATRA